MAQIVISEFMDQASVDNLMSDYDVLYDPGLVDDREKLSAAIENAQALIVRNRTIVSADLLENGTSLKVIGRLGVGLDNIDLEACKLKFIKVCPATGANDLSVAEYVISTSLALLRGSYTHFSSMIEGNWPRSELIGRELAGKAMGLVGFGNIAQEVARRARELGMSIIAYDPFVPFENTVWTMAEKCTTLEDLLARADVVSLHVPLNEGTKGTINKASLNAMKETAIIINTARGGVVDEEALAVALREGRLGGAALDVFEEEPLTKIAAEKFNGLDNLILTPHIAGVTVESNVRVSRVTAINVRNVLSGAS